MFKITNKQILARNTNRLDIHAEHIAKNIRPGQFVMMSVSRNMPRVPLTIVDVNPTKGTVSIIIRDEDVLTEAFGKLQINDCLYSVIGPLGCPADIKNVGVVVCIATGMGVAEILPIARALKSAGNKVIGIIGAKSKKTLILEPQMRLACGRIHITTNDGSYERRGLATDVLEELLRQGGVKMVYSFGSVDMMDAVSSMTKKKRIKIWVSLSQIIEDGMGMSGSCRIHVGSKHVLASVDGPIFDGHAVDFHDLKIRENILDPSNTQGFKKIKVGQSAAANPFNKLISFLMDG